MRSEPYLEMLTHNSYAFQRRLNLVSLMTMPLCQYSLCQRPDHLWFLDLSPHGKPILYALYDSICRKKLDGFRRSICNCSLLSTLILRWLCPRPVRMSMVETENISTAFCHPRTQKKGTALKQRGSQVWLTSCRGTFVSANQGLSA